MMEILDARQGAKASAPAGAVAGVLFAFWAAILPFDNVVAVGSLGTVTKYLGMLVALVVLGDRLLRGHGRIIRPSARTAVWGLFVVLAMASTIWSVAPARTAGSTSTLLGLYGMYVAVSLTPWSLQSVRRLETAVIIGGLAASVVTLYQFGSGHFYMWTERASLVIGEERRTDPNHFATSLILPFMLALNRCFTPRKGRCLSYVWIGMIGLVIILSGSRGAMLGLVSGGAFLAWKNRGSARRVMALLAIGAMLWLVVVQALPQDLSQRYSIGTVLASGGSGRLPLWRLAVYAFERRPLLGWGYDTFTVLTGGVLSADVSWSVAFGQVAHNIYLQALSELGVLGLGLLLTALALHLVRAARLAGSSPFFGATVAAFLGVAVTSATLGTLNYKYFWFLQMLSALTVYSPWSASLMSTQKESARFDAAPLSGEASA